jgi:hypothetical protein
MEPAIVERWSGARQTVTPVAQPHAGKVIPPRGFTGLGVSALKPSRANGIGPHRKLPVYNRSLPNCFCECVQLSRPPQAVSFTTYVVRPKGDA